MQPNERISLSNYRLEKAKEELDTAKKLLEINKFAKALNSSYYAMFHAVRSLLALDEFDAKRHSTVISHFIKTYVSAGKIDKEIGRTIVKAERVRIDSDYKDYYYATKESTEIQIQNADLFIPHLERFITQRQNEMK
jgi:uncharacterized protein (UPF0332 family)